MRSGEPGPGLLQRVLAVCRRRDGMAFADEVGAHDIEDVRFVVDDQDPSHVLSVGGRSDPRTGPTVP